MCIGLLRFLDGFDIQKWIGVKSVGEFCLPWWGLHVGELYLPSWGLQVFPHLALPIDSLPSEWHMPQSLRIYVSSNRLHGVGCISCDRFQEANYTNRNRLHILRLHISCFMFVADYTLMHICQQWKDDSIWYTYYLHQNYNHQNQEL